MTDDTITPDITETPVVEKRHKRKNRRPERVLPRAVFRRIVREITQECAPTRELRFQENAIDALQEAGEDLLKERFRTCGVLADMCRNSTVKERHWACCDHINDLNHQVRG